MGKKVWGWPTYEAHGQVSTYYWPSVYQANGTFATEDADIKWLSASNLTLWPNPRFLPKALTPRYINTIINNQKCSCGPHMFVRFGEHYRGALFIG